jgi:hypothetical protein
VAARPYPTLRSELRRKFSPSMVIIQNGLTKGVRGRNRGWLIAFLAFRGFVGLKHTLSRQSEFIAIDRLKPGERILIRTIPVHSAKQRKRLLRGK